MNAAVARLLRFVAACLMAASVQACGHAVERPQPEPSAPSAGAAGAFDPAASDAHAWTQSPPGEARGAETARAAVDGFYAIHVGARASGIPRGDLIAKYRPWLSKRLAALLAAAALERDRAIAEAPDMKPPFVDGDPFGSLFEGPTAYRIAERAGGEGDHARFDVRLSYRDPSGESEWTDRAIVLRESGRWVIDDIEYGGNWDFAARGSLSGTLRTEGRE